MTTIQQVVEQHEAMLRTAEGASKQPMMMRLAAAHELAASQLALNSMFIAELARLADELETLKQREKEGRR